MANCWLGCRTHSEESSNAVNHDEAASHGEAANADEANHGEVDSAKVKIMSEEEFATALKAKLEGEKADGDAAEATDGDTVYARDYRLGAIG